MSNPSSGTRIIDLSIGQPDFPTPQHIKKAGRRAIDENFTRYTPQPGFQDLREAIAGKFESENGIRVSPDQVVVSCGGKHSLYNIIQCVVGSGDEVILLQPYWAVAPEQIRRAGGTPVVAATREDKGFQPDPQRIGDAVTGATKVIVVNSPCNPTGAVYSRELLAEIGDIAVQHDLLIISDEVYERIVFDDAEHVSVASFSAGVAARTVTVNSVSKTHSMTGWRIGYAAMPLKLARKVTDLQSISTSGPCAVSQRAALAALTEDQSHVSTMVGEYARRRHYLLDRLRIAEGVSCSPPQGTFYLFLNISELTERKIRGRAVTGSADLVEILLEEAGVKVVPGEYSGSDRHVRVSFAASMEALEEGLDRIEHVLGS